MHEPKSTHASYASESALANACPIEVSDLIYPTRTGTFSKMCACKFPKAQSWGWWEPTGRARLA